MHTVYFLGFGADCDMCDLGSLLVFPIINEGVRVRVSQPSIYNSCQFFIQICSKCPYRTNQQELYIEGWLALALTPSIIIMHLPPFSNY